MIGRGKKGNQGSDLHVHEPQNNLQKKTDEKKGAIPLSPVKKGTSFVWLVGGAWVRGSYDPSSSTAPRDVSTKTFASGCAHTKLGPDSEPNQAAEPCRLEKPLQQDNLELVQKQKETSCIQKPFRESMEQMKRLRAESEQRRCRSEIERILLSETTIKHREKLRKQLAGLDPAEPPIQQSHNPNLTDIQKVQHCDLEEQLKQTQQESERLHQVSTKLQEELDGLKVAQAQGQNPDQEDTLEVLRKKYLNLYTEKMELLEKLEARNEDIKQLRDQQASDRSDIYPNATCSLSANGIPSLDDPRAEVVRLRNVVEEKDKKIESLKVQARSLQQVASEREKLQGHSQDQSRIVMKLKDNLKAAQDKNCILKNESETARLVETFQPKLKEAKTQLSEAEHEKAHLQDEIEVYKNVVEAEIRNVKKLQVQRRSPHSPFQQELTEKEATLGKLQTQLNLAHAEIQELKAQKKRELGEIETENAQLHQRLVQISDSKEVIEKKYRSMMEQVQSLYQMKQAVDDVRSQASTLTAITTANINKRIEELQNEVEVRKQEVLQYKEDFERERKDRENAAGRHVEEIAGWQLTCQKLKDDFDKLEAENQEKLTEHWQMTYQKLQKERHEDQEAFQKRQQAFEDEINTLTQEKERKEKYLQEEIDKLKDVLQRTQTGLHDQVAKLNGQITELKEENIQQRNSFDAARDESAQNTELKETLKVLKKKFLNLYTEKMELLEKLEARDEDIKQLRDQQASDRSDTYPNATCSLSADGIPSPDDPRAEVVRLRNVLEEKDKKIESLKVQARSLQQVASEREKLQGHSQDQSRTVMKMIVVGLRKELEQAKEENRILSEGSKTSEQIESLKLKLKDVQKKLTAAELYKQHLENEVDFWKQEVDGERENIRRLKGQLASLQAQRRSHPHDSYQKELAEREVAVGHVETQQYLVEAELAALRGDVDQKEKELAVAGRENAVLKQRVKEVSDANDELQKKYHNCCMLEHRETEERTKVIQDELEISKQQALQYKEDFERERKDHEAAIECHDSLQEAYQGLQTQKNLVDAELATLRGDVAQREKDLAVVGGENIVLQQRYKEISYAHDELQQKYHNMLEQLQTLDRMKIRMETFRTQVFTLTANVKENAERNKVIQDELEVSKQQALQYKEDFERERKDHEAAIECHDSLQEAYQGLQTQKNLVDAELATLRGDVAQREKDLAVVGGENIVLQQRYKEVSDAHDELQQKCHNMLEQLETLDQMTAQIQAFRVQVSTVTGKLKENEERSRVIRDELEVSKHQAIQYKEDFERERKDHEDAAGRHAEEVANLQTAYHEIEKEMQQKQEMFQQAQRVLEDDANKMKRENEQLKEEVTNLQGETQGLQEILKQTQDALDDQFQIAKLNHEITELKEENIQQRNSFDAARAESDHCIAELTKQLEITSLAKAEFEKCTADLAVDLEQAKDIAHVLIVDKQSLEKKIDDIDKDRCVREKNLEIALNEKAALNKHLKRVQEEIVQVRQQLELTAQESSVEVMGKNQQVRQFKKQVEEITCHLQETRAELERVRGQYTETGTELERVKVQLQQTQARMQEQAQFYQEQMKQTDKRAAQFEKEACEIEKLLIKNELCQLNGRDEDLRHRYDVLFRHNYQLQAILRKHNVSPPPLPKVSHHLTPPQYQTEQPLQAQQQMGNIQHGGRYTVNLKQQIPAVTVSKVVPEQQYLDDQHDQANSLPQGGQYDVQKYHGVTAQGMVDSNQGYSHKNVSPHHQHQLRQIIPRPSPASRYTTLKRSILELEETTAALESKKKAAYSQLLEELELSQENIQQLENRISDLENHVEIGAKHQKMIVAALEVEKQEKSSLQNVLNKTLHQSEKMYKQSQSAIKHLQEQIHWLNKTLLHWYEAPNKMIQNSRDKLKPFVIQEPVQLGANVGRGCYGAVYSCTIGNVSIKCIAKQIHNALVGGGEYEGVSDMEKSTIISNFQRECTILSTARHPNVVQFVGVCYGREQHDLQLIMERLPTDLEKLLAVCHEKNNPQDGFKLPLSVQVSFLSDIATGLLYLHSKSIVHRDLNSGNVLLTADLQAKIADLGVSKLHPEDSQKLTQAPGASGYMPPEALDRNPVYDEKIDVFSFGVLSLYIANQNFPEVSQEHVPDRIHHKGEGEIFKRKEWIDVLKTQQHPFHNLVQQCLLEKRKRPQTTEVVEIVHRMREVHLCTIQETLNVFAHFHNLTHGKKLTHNS